jgi:ABC-type transport system involved in cytochrome c biogenesis permease subunit
MFLTLSVLEKTNLISLSLYPLQVAVGVALAMLMITDWWRAQRRPLIMLIGALLLIVLFTFFSIFEEFGILRDYPFFILVCVMAALTLIGYLVYRSHTTRIASRKTLSDSKVNQ